MNQDLTTGRPSKVLLIYSLPIILGNVFQQVYAMVDSAVVGRFVGYEALAGVGATNGLFFLVMGFVLGITGGLGICMAQFFGAKDGDGLKRSVAVSIRISIWASAALTVIPLLLCPPVLRLMNTPAEIFPYAIKYISLIFLGSTAQVCIQHRGVHPQGDRGQQDPAPVPHIFLGAQRCS